MVNINEIYPLTIIRDSYNGVYSGGCYLAINLNYDEIPIEISGSDIPCLEWWKENKYILVGKGYDITSAIFDLVVKMNDGLYED